MANKKIPDLASPAPLTGTELLEAVQTGISVRVTAASLAALTAPGGTNGQVQANNAGAFGGLTNTQLTALVNDFTSLLPGSVPASGGGTSNFLRADGTWTAPTVPTGANPTANVGLATVNGAAATFMRSDGAPPLSQSITPTWSGAHNFTGGITINGINAGYLGLPQNAQSVNYQLALTDAGKHIYNSSGANTYTIPANATVAFAIGDAVTFVNAVGAGNAIIAAAGGVTLLQAGTANSGNRTLAAQGMATILKVATNTWFINGVGLT